MSRSMLICVFICLLMVVDFISSTPVSDEDALTTHEQQQQQHHQDASSHLRMKRWVCNNLTGDFLCAGWPGAWRCHCGANCIKGACTCKHC